MINLDQMMCSLKAVTDIKNISKITMMLKKNFKQSRDETHQVNEIDVVEKISCDSDEVHQINENL